MARELRTGAELLAALVAIGIAWDLYVRLSGVPNYLLPAPLDVLASIGDLAASGQLSRHLGFTLATLTAGFAVGAVVGAAAGVLLARMPRLERAVGGPILFLQTAPKIALAPLFVIWFGLGATSKLVLVVSLVLFPVLVGTLVGLRGVDPRLHDLARLLRLTAWQRFRRVELPAAMPEIFVGLRVGAVQAVVGAILGEWMSGKDGLGYLMTFATATYKTPMLFAAVLLTVLLGIAVYQLVDALERRALSWREPA